MEVGDNVPVKINCDVGDRLSLLDEDIFCTLLDSPMDSGLDVGLTVPT